MSRPLLDVAQTAMDSFYQDFRPANAFYTIEDFAVRVDDEKNSELEREFLVQYQLNKRTFPIINPAWLKNVFIDLVKDKETGEWSGEICDPLFEFPFDESGAGVQQVVPMGNGCAEFVRINHHQGWQVCITPSLDISFFSIEGCRILLYNFFGCTEKLRVSIVPSQSGLTLEQRTVPDGKVAQIIEVVLNRMWRDYQVKFGKISAHNNENPNSEPNETGAVYEHLKTK